MLAELIAVHRINNDPGQPVGLASALGHGLLREFSKGVPVLLGGLGCHLQCARRLGVMMDAEVVAEAGLTAMFARRAEHIPGRLTRAMTLAAVLTPQWVIDLLRRHGPWLPRRVDPPRS